MTTNLTRWGLALGMVGLLAGATAPVTAHAKTAPAIKSSDLTRYFKSPSSKTAFYLKTIKAGKQKQKLLILGDFGRQPGVRYGMPVSQKYSRNRQTMTMKYRPVQFKLVGNKYQTKVLKTTYTLKLTKKTKSTFTAKLSTKKMRYLTGNGKNYRYTMTKSNPVKTYANKYAKPTLKKQAEELAKKQMALTTAEKKSFVTKMTDQSLKNLIRNFNYQ